MMDLSGTAITDKYPMRMLCGKRYDNGFPFDSMANGLPRTCLEDTVLVPLASWIFYVGLIGLIIYAFTSSSKHGSTHKKALHKLVHRKSDSVHSTNGGGDLLNESNQKNEINSTSSLSKSSWSQRHTKLASSLNILYSLLVCATLLMNILEIVRLYLADRGAGLLPFTLASLVIVLGLMHIPTSSRLHFPLSAVIFIFWTFSMIFTSVQLSTITHLSTVEPRLNTEYLNSDQAIDVGVMVGLYAIEFLVEGGRMVKLFRYSRKQ